MELTHMFEEIEHYHKTLGYHYKAMSHEQCLDNIRHTGLALYQEVGELIDSFPWKPWRTVETQVYDKENAIEEIVDCIFFLGAIRAAGKIPPQAIATMFDTKLRENYDRIKRGYNSTPDERR